MKSLLGFFRGGTFYCGLIHRILVQEKVKNSILCDHGSRNYSYNHRMRKIHSLLLGAVAVAGLLAGCGGSGGGTSTASSLKKYEAIMNRVFQTANTSNAMGTFPQPSRSGRSGLSADLIKQKISNLIHRKGLKTRDGEIPPDGGGGSVGGDGGGEEWRVGTVYFDDWAQLWVRIDQLEAGEGNGIRSYYGFKSSFWEDQALTKPAGSVESSQTTENGKDVYRYKHVITAGPEKGFMNESVWSVDQATGDTAMTYTYTDGKGQYEFTGTGSYSVSTQEYSFSNRSKHADGTTLTSSGKFKDGKSTYSMEDNRGYKIQYEFNADWSGSFRLEGPESILPAVGNWNSEGKGQVRFADGTVEDIEFFQNTGFLF